MACILFADDEPSIRDMLRRHLKLAGHVCLAAKDGAEARALLAQHHVYMALLDVMMPGEDGFRSHPPFWKRTFPCCFSPRAPLYQTAYTACGWARTTTS